MGLIETIKSTVSAPSPRNRPDDGSAGAYWCDDCDVRIRDVDLDGEPNYPECGSEMRFERSKGRSCAC